MYLYTCKTKGKCRQLAMEKAGFDWSKYPHEPRFGTKGVWTDKGYGFESFRGNYKCCTQCHKPLNDYETAKANKLLGNKIEEVVFDDEFMELLNGI